MNLKSLLASRTLPYTGEPVEISATIASKAKLTGLLDPQLWPHLSLTEERDEDPIGPQIYVLVEAETNFGGEPVLVFRTKPEDPDALERSLRAKMQNFGDALRQGLREQIIKEIVEKSQLPPLEPGSGIDPADYMSGALPYEIRVTKAVFEAGSLPLYFENDNLGIWRTRTLVLSKKDFPKDMAANVEKFLVAASQVARATPDTEGDKPSPK